LREPRLKRAIGVIYLQRSERASHYFHAHLPDQLDFVSHYGEARAVESLERTAEFETGEVPEIYLSAV
jgi:erythromycin esterase-like protein